MTDQISSGPGPTQEVKLPDTGRPIMKLGLALVVLVSVLGLTIYLTNQQMATPETYLQQITDQQINMTPAPENPSCEVLRNIIDNNNKLLSMLNCKTSSSRQTNVKSSSLCNDVIKLATTADGLLRKSRCSTSGVPRLPNPSAEPVGTMTPIVTMMPISSQIPTTSPQSGITAGEGQVCYGYAGLPCAEGLYCAPNPYGQTGPDAGGICRKLTQDQKTDSSGPETSISPLPSPWPVMSPVPPNSVW